MCIATVCVVLSLSLSLLIIITERKLRRHIAGRGSFEAEKLEHHVRIRRVLVTLQSDYRKEFIQVNKVYRLCFVALVITQLRTELAVLARPVQKDYQSSPHVEQVKWTTMEDMNTSF